jgi:Uma2 family endonuclease
MTDTAARQIQLVYPVPETDPRWELEDDETMPESLLHRMAVDLLRSILEAWARTRRRNAMVAANMALRWDRVRPRVGVDPDIMLVEPAPAEVLGGLTSVCTWKPGHHPPRVAVEVVSEGTADKDYGDGPAKYAASGTCDLWVFDPEGFGPGVHGGPYVLQVWRRDDLGRFTRVYAGDGPTCSEELGAWLVITGEGRQLRIADDREGTRLWQTDAERERAEKERERMEKERERTEKEAALAELAALRARLAATGAD